MKNVQGGIWSDTKVFDKKFGGFVIDVDSRQY